MVSTDNAYGNACARVWCSACYSASGADGARLLSLVLKPIYSPPSPTDFLTSRFTPYALTEAERIPHMSWFGLRIIKEICFQCSMSARSARTKLITLVLTDQDRRRKVVVPRWVCYVPDTLG